MWEEQLVDPPIHYKTSVNSLYQLRITQQDNKKQKKIKILKNYSEKNKTSPLLKTPEKDFQIL